MTMMKAKTSLRDSKEPPARTHKLDSSNPKLTYIGGSKFDAWNGTLANHAVASGWYGNNPDADRTHKQQSASLSFLAGVEPKDELEGMLAAQLLASHNAAMECYRRSMIAEQTFEGRKENLSQANKLSRTHATLLEALNRHRGKGQQIVTVEHVHVRNGGQAIVGNVEGGHPVDGGSAGFAASSGRGPEASSWRPSSGHLVARSPRCPCQGKGWVPMPRQCG